MSSTVAVKTMQELLEASQATPEFKQAMTHISEGNASELIRFNAGAPPVKQLRLLMKLLEERSEWPIERVEGRAVSGCSNFTGKLIVHPGKHEVHFNWDCRWRAEQQGWKDAFDEPDQIRAARELGYQCFEKFEITE